MRALKNNTLFIKYKIYRINLMASFSIYLEDGRHCKNHLHFLTSVPKRPVAASAFLLEKTMQWCRQGTSPCCAW